MSTLAQRLAQALDAKMKRDPSASQAELARYCGAKGPSVSDWFTGETKTLKAQSLVLAAEYLEVRPRWLLDGRGPMADGDLQAPPARPALSPNAEYLAGVLDKLTERQQEQIIAVADMMAGPYGHMVKLSLSIVEPTPNESPSTEPTPPRPAARETPVG